MSYLTKEKVFFDRDENGNVLPVDVTLETLDNETKIKATPLNKGELNKLSNNINSGNETDVDIDIIIKHCKEPKFTEEDRESLKSASKLQITNAIVTAILSLSTNISQKDIIEQGKQQSVDKEMQAFQKG